ARTAPARTCRSSSEPSHGSEPPEPFALAPRSGERVRERGPGVGIAAPRPSPAGLRPSAAPRFARRGTDADRHTTTSLGRLEGGRDVNDLGLAVAVVGKDD